MLNLTQTHLAHQTNLALSLAIQLQDHPQSGMILQSGGLAEYLPIIVIYSDQLLEELCARLLFYSSNFSD